MRRLVAAAPLVLLVTLLASCGGDKGPILGGSTPSSSAFPGDTWSLEWYSGGGLIGLSSRVTVDSTGKVTTKGGRPQQTRDGTVTATDVASIRDQIRAANLPELSKKKDTVCPDCIETRITVTSGSATYTAAYVNRKPEPTAERLFDTIGALYQSFSPEATPASGR